MARKNEPETKTKKKQTNRKFITQEKGTQETVGRKTVTKPTKRSTPKTRQRNMDKRHKTK
jgi:hypothetical protein